MVANTLGLDELVTQRCTDISNNIIVKNTSIQIKEKQLLVMLKKLKLNLVNENRELFMEYCDLSDCICSESEHIIYKQGFKDGLKIIK